MKAARVLLSLLLAAPAAAAISAETDLDAFMKEVLVRRDDNWKKLQQFVLDEQERTEIRGPEPAAAVARSCLHP